jgi:hypothetical protein
MGGVEDERYNVKNINDNLLMRSSSVPLSASSNPTLRLSPMPVFTSNNLSTISSTNNQDKNKKNAIKKQSNMKSTTQPSPPTLLMASKRYPNYVDSLLTKKIKYAQHNGKQQIINTNNIADSDNDFTNKFFAGELCKFENMNMKKVTTLFLFLLVNHFLLQTNIFLNNEFRYKEC